MMSFEWTSDSITTSRAALISASMQCWRTRRTRAEKLRRDPVLVTTRPAPTADDSAFGQQLLEVASDYVALLRLVVPFDRAIEAVAERDFRLPAEEPFAKAVVAHAVVGPRGLGRIGLEL